MRPSDLNPMTCPECLGDVYDEIMEAVHTAEAELGIEYEHDKS